MRRKSAIAATAGATCASLLLGACSFGGGGGTATTTSTPVPVGAPASLAHAGKWLVDAEGRVVVLHGMNLVDKSAPYYPSDPGVGFTAADASYLASHGFNVVRLGVLFEGVEPEPGQIDSSYLDQIQTTVSALEADHIWVLLDFHQDLYGPALYGTTGTPNQGADGFPAWATLTSGVQQNTTELPSGTWESHYWMDPALNKAFDNFWGNAKGPDGVGIQANYDKALTAVAAKFGDEPYLLGYDIMNEPWPGSGWASCAVPLLGCPSFENGPYLSFIKNATSAIRQADADHIVFFEPLSLFNIGIPTNIPATGDAEVGMSFHNYCLTTGWNSIPGGSLLCGADESLVINNAEAEANRTGAALLNTEWGDSTDTATLDRITAEENSSLLSWIYWPVNVNPVVDLTSSTAEAGALEQPYAQAIAGTPQNFSFDPTTKAYALSYSTSRVGGGNLASGTATVISVPMLQYPSGYSVHVTGGVVTSPAGATVVTVVSDTGASIVTVTIGPA